MGRDQELASARKLALQPHVRLLTLTEPGGVGKTRFAAALGRALQREFPGGVYFVPLEKISSFELVPWEVAAALNVPPRAGGTLISSLKEYVRESCVAPTLVLLDNFEHVQSAAPLITELLAASERLKIIVTSRATLHVYGEYEFSVAPLAAPDPRATLTAAALAQSPAVVLFL